MKSAKKFTDKLNNESSIFEKIFFKKDLTFSLLNNIFG